MKSLTEKEFQTKWIADYKNQHPNSWLYKIPDINMQIKPFDIIICNWWKSVAIELKVCNLKKWLSYKQAYNMLRPNQVWALSAHQLSWWISAIVVYNNANNTHQAFDFKLLENWNNGEL